MHTHNLNNWQHSHTLEEDHAKAGNEKRTLWVVYLTIAMMVIEITSGLLFNSMALLADGWHMASHAGALGLTVFAYRYVRRHAHERSFTFGVGKVEILGGYTNAVVLGLVALFMVYESVERMLNPLQIAFDQAMLVAVIGLIVNLFSAWMLHGGGHDHHHHSHAHGHGHGHGHHHSHGTAHTHHDHVHDHHAKDHNLHAAYLHVLADALTSVLAIAALLMGKSFGWTWVDAAMGIVGAFVIGKWSYGLMTETGSILLDRVENSHLDMAIAQRIEADADNRIVDQHLWLIGPGKYSVILSVVTHYPRSADHYKALLADIHQIGHMTIEVNTCVGEPCIPVDGLEAAKG